MFHTLGVMKNRVAQSEAEMEGEYRINGETQVLRSADRIIAATLAEQAQLQFLYKADTEQDHHHPARGGYQPFLSHPAG